MCDDKIRKKQEIREIALAKRAKISSADEAEKIADNFFDKITIPANSLIGFYMPFNNEIDVLVLAAKCAEAGHKLCMPRMDNVQKKMLFCEYKIGTDLQKNKFGIEEPSADATQAEPSVIILPLVAFDRDKNRLGYGGGYYDRYLQNRDVLKIGVAYAAQELEKIPAEAHDIKMDKIITEDFVL